MALQRDTRYPGRWTTGNSAHPQGAFKNRSAPGALDGSYIEQDWANDWDGFFASLLSAASITANGSVDAVGSSQYFTAMLNLMGHGQCRLSVGSTTTLVLAPYNGRNVIVNGIPLQIPTAGITYTASGLAASTVYYVYLGGTTAAPVISLSTTAYVTGTNGVVVKSGDATQTLVGMVRTNASTQFVDSLASRTCLNWFNRRNLPVANPSSSTFTFTSTTPVEASTTLRAVFLTWADDGVDISISGDISSTAASIVSLQLFLDAAVVGPVQQATIQSNGQYAAFSSRNAGFYTEGLHTVSPYVCVPSGGATGTLQHVQTNAVVRG